MEECVPIRVWDPADIRDAAVMVNGIAIGAARQAYKTGAAKDDSEHERFHNDDFMC
jgi:hypothetical protein